MALGRRLEKEWVWGRVTNLVWDTLSQACLQDMQMVVYNAFQSGAQESSSSLRIFMHCFCFSGSLTENGLRTKPSMRRILSRMLQELPFV